MTCATGFSKSIGWIFKNQAIFPKMGINERCINFKKESFFC